MAAKELVPCVSAGKQRTKLYLGLKYGAPYCINTLCYVEITCLGNPHPHLFEVSFAFT